MNGNDPYDYSRNVQRGKSMGEFGEVDTTRTIGRQGWKIKIETNPRKKKRSRRSLSLKIKNWLRRKDSNLHAPPRTLSKPPSMSTNSITPEQIL